MAVVLVLLSGVLELDDYDNVSRILKVVNDMNHVSEAIYYIHNHSISIIVTTIDKVHLD